MKKSFKDMSDEELKAIISSPHKKSFKDMSDEELEEITGKSQPQESQEQEESQGWSGIGRDIKNSLWEAPGQIIQGIKQIPSESIGALKQYSMIPWEALHGHVPRFSKNVLAGLGELGHGILSAPANIADYAAKKGLLSQHVADSLRPDSLIPKDFDYAKGTGIEGKEAGDILTRGLPSSIALGGLGELGQAKGLLRGVQRAGAGGTQAIVANENPLTAAIASSVIPSVTNKAIKTLIKAPRIIRNPAKVAREAISKAVLEHLKKGAKYGDNLTPEQTNQHLLSKYLNENGQPMPVDIGTLTNNKLLKGVYNVISKIPLVGERSKLNQLEHQEFNKSDAVNKVIYDDEISALEQKEKKHKTALADIEQQEKDINKQRETEVKPLNKAITEQMKEHEALKARNERAPELAESLRHETPHENLLKEEIVEAKKKAQSESKKLYEPVNKFDKNFKKMNLPDKFQDRYKKAADEFGDQAGHVRKLFGDESDVGSKLSSELKRSKVFLNKKDTKTKPIYLKILDNIKSFFIKKDTKTTPIYLKDILDHVKTLRNSAAILRDQGRNTEAAAIDRMASGLKDDAKDILHANGHTDIAKALDTADKHHISDVLPFYEKKEIRKITNNKQYIPNKLNVSKILRNKNFDAIMKRLSPEARKATLYELLTEGKYSTKHGASLTSKELGKNFQALDSSERDVLRRYLPEMIDYFEDLQSGNLTQKEMQSNLSELQKSHENLINALNKKEGKIEKQTEKHKIGLEQTEEQRKSANKILKETIEKRYGKRTSKSGTILDTVNNFKPLHTGALSALLFALHGAHPLKLIAEVAGALKYPAKWTNQALTNPELIEHFIKGTKSNSVRHSPMELELIKQFSKPSRVASYSVAQKQKD